MEIPQPEKRSKSFVIRFFQTLMGGNKKKVKVKQTVEETLYENVEAVLVAIVLALVLKFFALEAFKIPTGSMAPHLLGLHANIECPRCGFPMKVGVSEHDAQTSLTIQDMEVLCTSCNKRFDNDVTPIVGGNRILVNKYLYNFKKPDRYDIIVFKAPTEPHKNFIKRCVAFENEELEILRGDIYIKSAGDDDYSIARKPVSIQDSLWIPVYDSNYWVDPSDEDAKFWESGNWLIEKDGFHPSDTAGEYQLWKKNAISNDYSYNKESSQSDVVGDLLLQFEFAPVESGKLKVVIGEDIDQFELVINFNSGRPELSLNHLFPMTNTHKVIFKSKSVTLKSSNHIYFTNVDDAVIVKLNGENVWEQHEYEPSSEDRDLGSNEIKFTAEHCPVILTHIQIDRDIHYDWGTNTPSTLQNDMLLNDKAGKKYFVCFGDNVNNSQDSRNWGVVPADNLLGKALLSFWPPKKKFPYLNLNAIR